MSMITVRVLFFGAARDAVGEDQIELKLASGSTGGQALEQLISNYPDVSRFGKSQLLAVDQEYADGKRQLRDGDELAGFPPVSGGDEGESKQPGKDFFELTTDAIDVGALARRVVLP